MYNALCYLQLYLKIYDSEIKYRKYTDKILKEMTALECENARSARSYYILSMLVFCRYTVVYSAIPQVRGNCIDCTCR